MIRRYFFPIVLTLILCLVVVFLFFNSNYVLSQYLQRFVEEYFHQAQVLSFRSGQQYYTYPDLLILKEVEASFQYQSDIYRIEADEIILRDVFRFWRAREDLRITATGLSVYLRKLAARSFDINLNVKVGEGNILFLQGIFRKMRLEALPYIIDDISGKINMDKKFIELVELSGFWDTPAAERGSSCASQAGDTEEACPAAAAQNGSNAISVWHGQVKTERNLQRNYTLYLEFSDLDPATLRDAEPVFSEIHGLLEGTLRLAGKSYRIDQFVLDLKIPGGGALGPGMLKMLNPFVADSVVSRKFSKMIADNQAFEFDWAALLIQDFRDYRGQIMVNLINRGENINCMEKIPLKGRVNWLDIFCF